MRILSITAQKPGGTGSGVFLTETAAALDRAGHDQAVVFGAMPDDPLVFGPGSPLPDVTPYPVRFSTALGAGGRGGEGASDGGESGGDGDCESGGDGNCDGDCDGDGDGDCDGDGVRLSFPVAGMSDHMPYEATRYRDFTPTMLDAFKSAFARAISRAIGEFNPDLIVCHHLYIVAAVATHLGPSCPVVAVCHGTDIRQMEKHDLDNEYVREGISRMDVVYALTAEQADEIAGCYRIPREAITVLGTGYNAQMFSPPADESRRRPGNVLFVGKVCGKKGVPNLINAMNLLVRQDDGWGESPFAVDQDEPFHLRLVGGHSDGSDYVSIEQLAQESEVPVELAGRVSQNTLVESYRTAKVFALPSFFEGLPLVLIEAMACGCVAVATDLPGVRPWLAAVAPDAPILFVAPPRMRDVDEPYPEDVPRFEADLAAAIATALSMQGKPEAVAHLSWDALVGRLLEGI